MTRYRLILRNKKDFFEKDLCAFSYKFFWGMLFFLLIIIFVLNLYLFSTVFSKWVNPLHLYKISSQKVCTMYETVASLNKEVASNENYINVLQNLIKGHSNYKTNDLLNVDKANVDKILEFESPEFENAISEKKMNVESDTNLVSDTFELKDHLILENLFSPVVSTSMTKISSFGPDSSLVLSANQVSPLCCIADGVVLFSDFVRSTQEIVTIVQHSQNVVSIYRYVSFDKLKQSTKINAGDVLAFLSKKRSNTFCFDLFILGNRVNPEKYINFYL